MTTLIIHPNDPSTRFLEVIYKDIPNKTVITGRTQKNKIASLIESHDRVMIMGHGCPYGLFSVGQFDNGNGLILDYTNVEPLKKKDNTVFIWCNADQFVNNHNLKGFYSGMFISEIMEAVQTICVLGPLPIQRYSFHDVVVPRRMPELIGSDGDESLMVQARRVQQNMVTFLKLTSRAELLCLDTNRFVMKKPSLCLLHAKWTMLSQRWTFV